jgi:hypothetical protein
MNGVTAFRSPRIHRSHGLWIPFALAVIFALAPRLARAAPDTVPATVSPESWIESGQPHAEAKVRRRLGVGSFLIAFGAGGSIASAVTLGVLLDQNRCSFGCILLPVGAVAGVVLAGLSAGVLVKNAIRLRRAIRLRNGARVRTSIGLRPGGASLGFQLTF